MVGNDGCNGRQEAATTGYVWQFIIIWLGKCIFVREIQGKKQKILKSDV